MGAPRSAARANSSELRVDRPSSPAFHTLGRKRDPTLDIFRGIGVTLMLGFHLLYDLWKFNTPVSGILEKVPIVFWRFTPSIIGSIFFLAVGASVWLTEISSQRSLRGHLRGVTKVACAAALVTLGTYLFDPQRVIVMGVLHCIAVVKLLMMPLVSRSTNVLLIWGAILSIAGFGTRIFEVKTTNLFWLGGIPYGVHVGPDYYPLLPWLGVATLGTVWMRMKSRPRSVSQVVPVRSAAVFHDGRLVLGWLGRHSIAIYLLHQPIFIALIQISKKIFLAS